MKDTFYFQHDFNAIQDPKMMDLLSSCGLSGIGMYWVLIEILHQQPDSQMSVNQYKQYIKFYCAFEHSGTSVLDKIEQVLITTGLIVKQDEIIYSNRVLENKKLRSELSEKRSIAGKASAEARRNKDILTSVRQKSTHVEQPSTRKGKERKVKKSIYTDKNLLSDLGWSIDPELFQKLKGKYPKLFTLKCPLQFDEHAALVKDWTPEKVRDIYSEMQNYAKLESKSESANLTARNWLTRNKKREAANVR